MRGLSLHLEAHGMGVAGSRLESISRALAGSFDLAFHGTAGFEDLLMSFCMPEAPYGQPHPGGQSGSEWTPPFPHNTAIDGGNNLQDSRAQNIWDLRYSFQDWGGVHQQQPSCGPNAAVTPKPPITPESYKLPKGNAHTETPTSTASLNGLTFASRSRHPRRLFHQLGETISSSPQPFLMSLPPMTSMPQQQPIRTVQSEHDIARERGYATTANRLLWRLNLLYGRQAPPDPLDNGLCAQLASLMKRLDQELGDCMKQIGMTQEHIARSLAGQCPPLHDTVDV